MEVVNDTNADVEYTTPAGVCETLKDGHHAVAKNLKVFAKGKDCAKDDPDWDLDGEGIPHDAIVVLFPGFGWKAFSLN